jgi:hypothetical protein
VWHDFNRPEMSDKKANKWRTIPAHDGRIYMFSCDMQTNAQVLKAIARLATPPKRPYRCWAHTRSMTVCTSRAI